MATYEYECTACKKRLEVQQKMADEPLKVCPECGKEALRRLFSQTSIQFQGSGFYITDYQNRSEKPPESCGKGSCGCH